ncbi:Integrase catalytic domain-containing protein, partial [Aphis craccivora]
CEFKSHEEIVRDKIVLDTRDGETRDKLIKQADVTRETAIETLRIAEIQRRELNQMKEIGKNKMKLVIVEKKNGSMRLCLDPRDLNENLIREYCVIPTLLELSSKVKNARVFSVFDLKDGFRQIKLDLDSSKLCTFGTMF